MCDVLFLRGLKPEFFLICEEFYEKKPPTIVENVTLSSFIIIKKKKIILYQPVSPSLKNNEIQTEENSSWFLCKKCVRRRLGICLDFNDRWKYKSNIWNTSQDYWLAPSNTFYTRNRGIIGRILQ